MKSLKKTFPGFNQIILIASIIFTFASCKGNSDKKVEADSTLPGSSAPVPGSPIKYDSSKRYIYLTWDDSPQPPGTIICEKIFRDENVKATFFAVAMHQFDHLRKNIIDSIRNSYPEFLLCNHSYSHGFRNNYKSFYAHPDSAVNDFLRAQEELKVPVKIIRLPGNNAWVGTDEMKGPKSVLPVCKKLDSLGYNVIGWDIEWRFKGGNIPVQSADDIVKEVNNKFENYTANTENHVVILAHDRMFAKPPYQDSLRKVITILKQDPRNAFETVDHYPIVQNK